MAGLLSSGQQRGKGLLSSGYTDPAGYWNDVGASLPFRPGGGIAGNAMSNPPPGTLPQRAWDDYLRWRQNNLEGLQAAAGGDPQAIGDLAAGFVGALGEGAPLRFKGGATADKVAKKLGLPQRAAVAPNLDAARTATPMGSSSGLFDLSRLNEVPPVPQFDLPRYEPPRGVSARATDLLNDRGVRDKMAAYIERGVEMGGPQWYNTEPLRERFVAELGPDAGNAAYQRYMDYVSATSPRSSVDDNIRNGSFYYWLEDKGVAPSQLPLNPYPYGHLAQNLHRQNAGTILGGGWDVFKNPKPPSFAQNLIGNQRPGTIDAHATKAPAMISEDPRWLATQYRQKVGVDEQGADVFANLKPREMYQSGDLSMEDALKRPVFWEGQPAPNEYAALEKYYRDLGQEQGLTTAQAQASSWVGAGDLTGLGTAPLPFMSLFDNVLLRTAAARGEAPLTTLNKFIRQQAPLLGWGAAGAAGAGGLLSSGNGQQ